MQIEYIIYGLAQGETREYMKTLLLATTDPANIEKVKELASQEGWHSFRVSTFNGEAPDFTKTLNV
jgi:hypothetical protein